MMDSTALSACSIAAGTMDCSATVTWVKDEVLWCPQQDRNKEVMNKLHSWVKKREGLRFSSLRNLYV